MGDYYKGEYYQSYYEKLEEKENERRKEKEEAEREKEETYITRMSDFYKKEYFEKKKEKEKNIKEQSSENLKEYANGVIKKRFELREKYRQALVLHNISSVHKLLDNYKEEGVKSSVIQRLEKLITDYNENATILAKSVLDIFYYTRTWVLKIKSINGKYRCFINRLPIDNGSGFFDNSYFLHFCEKESFCTELAFLETLLEEKDDKDPLLLIILYFQEHLYDYFYTTFNYTRTDFDDMEMEMNIFLSTAKIANFQMKDE